MLGWDFFWASADFQSLCVLIGLIATALDCLKVIYSLLGDVYIVLEGGPNVVQQVTRARINWGVEPDGAHKVVLCQAGADVGDGLVV